VTFRTQRVAQSPVLQRLRGACFITCRLLPHRGRLKEPEFECLARVVRERREKHHFFFTAWVFIIGTRSCSRAFRPPSRESWNRSSALEGKAAESLENETLCCPLLAVQATTHPTRDGW